MPDGVRDSPAGHIILESKITESLNESAVIQAIIYDGLYKQSQNLSAGEVQTVILSARKPQLATLESLGYEPTPSWPRVYRSRYPIIKWILLLSLNELRNEPHNAFVKLFASHKREKLKGLKAWQQMEQTQFPDETMWLISGLTHHWLTQPGEINMNAELTPDKLISEGKEWLELLLPLMPPELRLAGMRPEERLAGMRPEERLAGMQPEEIEAYLQQLKSAKKLPQIL